MTLAKIEINQISPYNNSYYTTKKDLKTLANFLAKQLKGFALDLVQDTKGNLEIRATYHAVNNTLNEYQTFILEDDQVAAVVDVIKSKEFPENQVMRKFTLKFAK